MHQEFVEIWQDTDMLWVCMPQHDAILSISSHCDEDTILRTDCDVILVLPC